MEKEIEISLLLDYYGELLTEKQKEIMSMYFDENLSLSEIADINETSRQAIHELINRTHKKLLNFESKLHLKEDSEKKEKIKSKVLKLMSEDINLERNKKIISLLEEI